MKTNYWIAIVVVALIVGILIGYGWWGRSAARLPQVQQQVATLQSELEGSKKKTAELEKENAELKQALEKPKK